jgi:hypothetical protein
MGIVELSRSEKYASFLLLIALFTAVLFLSLTPPTTAQSSTYASVSLQYFTVQVQYPAVVVPGTSITVHIQAIAKSTAVVNSLTGYVYYSDGSNLHQLASATIIGNQDVATGNAFASDLAVAVPQGMPPTSLFAMFTESIRTSYISSYGYSSNYYSNDYYCGSYYYGNMDNCYYPYYSSYPQYSYYTSTDTGISPLSYVNATTPQYTALQSQYQNQQQQLNQAQSQNQNLQQQVAQQSQQISQLQSQVEQLQQNLQTQQSAVSQKESDNSNLSSQLSSATNQNRTVTYLALGFGLIAILAIVFGSRRTGPKKTQSVNPYAANYAPVQEERRQTAQARDA